jgi:hypothetical protein
MSEEKPVIFTFDENVARQMISSADEEIEMVLDLLEEKIREDPVDLRVTSLLCDSFSSNYHIWKIMKTNLSHNLVEDKKGSYVAMSEPDLVITESAVLAKVFTKTQLLKLNYSLSLH